MVHYKAKEGRREGEDHWDNNFLITGVGRDIFVEFGLRGVVDGTPYRLFMVEDRFKSLDYSC